GNGLHRKGLALTPQRGVRLYFERLPLVSRTNQKSTSQLPTLPANGSAEFACFADNLGEPVGEAVEASAGVAMHLYNWATHLICRSRRFICQSSPVDAVVRARISPVRPLPSDGEGAMLESSQNQSIDTRYAPLLQNWEALAAKWVERMLDLSPAQRFIALMCS